MSVYIYVTCQHVDKSVSILSNHMAIICRGQILTILQVRKWLQHAGCCKKIPRHKVVPPNSVSYKGTTLTWISAQVYGLKFPAQILSTSFSYRTPWKSANDFWLESVFYPLSFSVLNCAIWKHWFKVPIGISRNDGKRKRGCSNYWRKLANQFVSGHQLHDSDMAQNSDNIRTFQGTCHLTKSHPIKTS